MKTIGFLIHQFEDDYSTLIARGAVAAAEDNNVNIVFFPGRAIEGKFLNDQYSIYEYQHNIIYNYADAECIDGLVVSTGTIGTFVDDGKMKDFLGHFSGTPIMTIERKIEGYPCLRFGAKGLYDLISHIIEDHGAVKIAFVGGPKGNPDSEERFEKYVQALSDHGIEFDPSYVAYGNFSEYSEKVVSELLDRHEEIPDAICFANDIMCIGAYKVLKKRGIQPGSDIIITGYDDSPTATELMPMLSTVSANPEALGYGSVDRLCRHLRGESELTDVLTDTFPVKRDSCGCVSEYAFTESELEAIIENYSDRDAVSELVKRILPEALGNAMKAFYREMEEIMFDIVCYVKNPDSQEKQLIISKFDRVLKRGVIDNITYSSFVKLFDALRIYLSVSSANKSSMSVFTDIYKAAMQYAIVKNHEITMNQTKTNFYISNITKDMMVYASDEDSSTLSVLDKLMHMGMNGSYIYKYRKAFNRTDEGIWFSREDDELTGRLILQGYQTGDTTHVVEKKNRFISREHILDNPYTEPEKRKTLVVAPLFSNELQYGLLVSNVDLPLFSSIYYLVPQISTSIKLNAITTYLESSLEKAQDSNSMLMEISNCDELTGAYNRRGFYTYANEMIHNAENDGRTGILIFGDLDNLKKINDRFGHVSGDYAIRTAAKYLSDALGENAVVARIGGDEFAAFCLAGTDDAKAEKADIYRRIKQAAEEHNSAPDRSFRVGISLGLHSFVCGPKVMIQESMGLSDNALYEDKKNKSTDI